METELWKGPSMHGTKDYKAATANGVTQKPPASGGFFSVQSEIELALELGNGHSRRKKEGYKFRVSDMLYEAELNKINILVDHIEEVDLADDYEFQAIFWFVTRLDVKLEHLSKFIGFNHGSISRWAQGKSKAHASNLEAIRSGLKRFLTVYRDAWTAKTAEVKAARTDSPVKEIEPDGA